MTATRWRNPLVWQWVSMLAVVSMMGAIAAASGALWRIDAAIYDATLPSGAAPSDVVIVAIDDASIGELGRWPWRRTLHAAMLQRLRAMGARAVALDLLLTEPDLERPDDDAALAAALGVGLPVVLPLLVEMPRSGSPIVERLPIAMFAAPAAGVGHAHLELDRDGVVRSVFLKEGLGVPRWPHFAAALLAAVPGASPPALRGARHPDLPGAASVWVRDHRILIPFLGPPGHFQQVSYVDILHGRVDAAAIRGKLVLIGATAQGIGDAYPTPRSGQSRAMAGVEIMANVVQALRSGTDIEPLPAPGSAALTVVPVLLAGLSLLLLAPWQSLTAVVALAAGTVGVSVLGLRYGAWWWPPGASLATLLVLYPLWSWRRLAVAQGFLEAEFRLLAGERFAFIDGLPAPAAAAAPLDFVEQRVELLRQATQRLRDVRRLLADTINALPDATVLVDLGGRIVLANPAAARLFRVRAAAELEEALIDGHLFDRVRDEHCRHAALSAAAPCTIAAAFADSGRHALIRAVPFSTSGERIGTILALTDITELRAAQSERDDVLRFLSHDMKSPASSLLGLAQLQRDPGRALAPRELSARLELLAQRLLTLVDGFVSLARAESSDPTSFEDFDLIDAVKDAYDEVWASAQARDNPIHASFAEEALVVHGDRQLLARAVVNLLSNALKFSPAAAPVEVTCGAVGAQVVVRVADRGPGIDPATAAMLFRRFSRRLHRGGNDPGGAGLGLAFVRVVAEKHGGRAWVESATGYGAVFCLAVASAAPSAEG